MDTKNRLQYCYNKASQAIWYYGTQCWGIKNMLIK